MGRNFAGILFCLSMALLVGCATPYQASGALGGYEEEEIEKGIYELSFIYNHVTGARAVEQYWHRRAAELCGGEELYEVLDEPEHDTFPYNHFEGKIKCVPASGANSG